MPTLQEMERSIEEKQQELHKLFKEHTNEKGEYTFTGTQLSEVNDRNDELTALGKALDDAKKLDAIAKKNAQEIEARQRATGTPPPMPAGNEGKYLADSNVTRKSIGEQFIESAACKGFTRGMGVGPLASLPDMDFKTVMSSGANGVAAAGWQPQSLRTGRVVLSAQEPIRVVEFLPVAETQFPLVKYMAETTFTNAAAPVAESVDATLASYPQSSLALTEQSQNVIKVATFIPVSDEQMEDVPFIRDYLNNRLTFMVQDELESQIIGGSGATGATPQLQGIDGIAGQTQAKGTDPNPDAIFKVITKVRVTGKAVCDGILMNPSDWQLIRLLRTADGLYIWGNPSDSGATSIWGLPVGLSTHISAGNAYAGAFQQYSNIVYRRGIDIQVSNSHASYFIQGVQAIRIDMRCALVWYRANAFGKVTGIA